MGWNVVGEVVGVLGGSPGRVVRFWKAYLRLKVHEAMVELVEGGEACLLSPLSRVANAVVAWCPRTLIFCSSVLPTTVLPTTVLPRGNRLWTFSSALMLFAANGSQTGLAYSSTGCTKAFYAAFLSLSFVILMFHLRKPKVWCFSAYSMMVLTTTCSRSMQGMLVREMGQ